MHNHTTHWASDMSTHHHPPAHRSDHVLVIGESLIDIVHKGEHSIEVVGGSPANVALGLGRLGSSPRLLTALGSDDRGRRIATQLESCGVTIDPASWSLSRTSTAAARIDPAGGASYEFDIEWVLREPIQLRAARFVHLGSIGAFLAPGADAITTFLETIHGQALVTFDPNIRPALVGSHASALARVEHLAARADVVKLSDEDASWLWPGASTDKVLDHLLECGATIAALTLGGDGSIAATTEYRVHVPAPRVSVVDTVGAGDTFMAAFIHGLIVRPTLLNDPTEFELAQAVHFAAVAASLTVQRSGADLPTWTEVHAALA